MAFVEDDALLGSRQLDMGNSGWNPSGEMKVRIVLTLVNNVKNDGPELIESEPDPWAPPAVQTG